MRAAFETERASQIQTITKYGYAYEDDFDLFYGSTESTTTLWKDNEVNGRYQIGYVYDYNISSEQDRVAMIETVVKMVSETTCIDFVPKTNERHYVKFDTTDGCSSLIGKQETYESPQTVSLAGGCGTLKTVHHELKHLLGFEHEHARADRDAYITVKRENIQEGKVSPSVRKEYLLLKLKLRVKFNI
ncbi:astacin-like metalloprotease toxin 1 [Styela clava]